MRFSKTGIMKNNFKKNNSLHKKSPDYSGLSKL